jgi:hypothetical protein
MIWGKRLLTPKSRLLNVWEMFMISLQIGVQPLGWYSVLKEFSPAFVALIAGLITSYIAWRQWKTTKDKLRIDLFDKRFEVYDSVSAFIAKNLRQGSVDTSDVLDFKFKTRSVEFLFDKYFKIYVNKICECAFRLGDFESERRLYRESLDASKQNKRNEDFQWMSRQFDELDTRAAKFLALPR